MNPIVTFLLYIASVLGQFSDDRTTEVALTLGYKEGNPVGRALLGKLGTSGMYALKTGALPVVGLLLAAKFPTAGTALQAFIAALGLGIGLRNFLVLRKNGVKFSQIF